MRTRNSVIILALAALAALTAQPVRALTIQDMARLKGQGESVLRGVGFVTGLAGTGDPSESLPLARQLAKLLENSGNPVPDLTELGKGKSIAMVSVTAVVPREGARSGDKIDVTVTTLHRAQSLEGGQLFITPMSGPLPGQPVFAFAQGPLMFDGPSRTSARVRGAAVVSRDITMNVVANDGSLTLHVEPAYGGWPTTQLVASLINAEMQGLDTTEAAMAMAMDERSVRIQIPDEELPDPANFISGILEMRLDPSLLSLPARVIVNEKRGTIVVTGDVEISAAAISHKDLLITTITPPREPSPNDPLVERSRWTGVTTDPLLRGGPKLQELLGTLRQLDVPAEEQIAILAKLHRIGRLHAEFIVE